MNFYSPAHQNSDLDDLLKRFERAKSKRDNWLPLWRESYDYALPQRHDLNDLSSGGQRRTDHIYDATAMDAVDRLSASLLGHLTPSWSQWFGLKPGPDLSPGTGRGTGSGSGESRQNHSIAF